MHNLNLFPNAAVNVYDNNINTDKDIGGNIVQDTRIFFCKKCILAFFVAVILVLGLSLAILQMKTSSKKTTIDENINSTTIIYADNVNNFTTEINNNDYNEMDNNSKGKNII